MVRDLESRVASLQQTVDDLKAQLKNEQEQHQFYQLIADFTFDWELWFDQSGQIKYCSPSCLNLTGYTANQIISVPSLSGLLVYSADQEKFDDFIHDSTNQMLINTHLDFRIVTRSRQIRWCSINTHGVYDAQGHYNGARASIHDITRLMGALGRISDLSAGRELENRNRQRLQSVLNIRDRELVAYLIQLSQKNERLVYVKKQLEVMMAEKNSRLTDKIVELLNYLYEDTGPAVDWDMIDIQLEKLHPGFIDHLKQKHPKLTGKDIKLCGCLRLGLTSKEVAGLNNLSPQSIEIARVRLRRKLKLPHEVRLTNYLMSI